MGLGPNFCEIAMLIQEQENSLVFEELHDLLVGHESYLRRLEAANQQMVMAANYTNKGKPLVRGDFSKKSYKPNGSQHTKAKDQPANPMVTNVMDAASIMGLASLITTRNITRRVVNFVSKWANREALSSTTVQ